MRYAVKLGMSLLWTLGPCLLFVPRGALRLGRPRNGGYLALLLLLTVVPPLASHLLVHFGVPGYGFFYVPASGAGGAWDRRMLSCRDIGYEREPSLPDRTRRAGPRLLASQPPSWPVFSSFIRPITTGPAGAAASTSHSPGTRGSAFKRPLPAASPPSGGRRIRESWPPSAGVNETEVVARHGSVLLSPRENQDTSTLR